MLINADFSRPVAITPDQYHWVTSPQPGVERMMLDRVGDEKARATSIVRYVAGSTFPHHEHPDGEEILVLSGTFSDENGDYPAGWYLRSPPGSAHRPYSDEGALIFVKLQQMPPEEHLAVRIDTGSPASWQRATDGHEICPLFSSAAEQVCLRRLTSGQSLHLEATGGAEMLVLSGDLLIDGQDYGQGSWIRLPVGAQAKLDTDDREATFYLKTGHLVAVPEEK